MTAYIQYELEDGSVLLVEVGTSREGMVEATAKDRIIESNEKFRQALKGAKASIKDLIAELHDLPVEEMEITFGLKSVGEAGFFAVGKVGLEANYQVQVKWKKPTKGSDE